MKKTTVLYAIAFAFSSFGNSSEQLQVQPALPIGDFLQVAFTQPKAPPDAPKGRERGTGSRSGCSIAASPETKVNLTLTPLIPYKDSTGYTSVESPTIWVNVSYKTEIPDNKKISGRVLVQHPKTHEDLLPSPISVTLPRTSGTFSIPFPYSLNSGEWSRWYLELNDCEIYVEGLVQRVNPQELKNQLEGKTPQERFAFYVEKGLWYDALNEAIEIRCRNQQSSSSNDPWEVLLSADEVKLQEITKTPLICPQ